MTLSSSDIVPFGQVRARLTELAEGAATGREKIITRNGEAYVALIAAGRLDHYHRLEREHIHLQLLDDAAAGWADVEQGRVMSIAEIRRKYGRE